MLSATEFYSVTTGLAIVLWIEAVVYLGIGVFELFDDFLEKPQPWMTLNGRVNGYLRITHKVGHKMHAGICCLLGFVALNGALEGALTRLELELIFISFAVLMPAIWALLMPGRLGLMMVILKPEFWLQIVMFVGFSHLIRPEIALLCIGLNLWGIFVYFRHTRKSYFQPFTYEALRSDYEEALGEGSAARIDKLAGYRPPQTGSEAS